MKSSAHQDFTCLK